MEKFTKFRDAGTGIAPFLPIAPASRAPLVFPFELTLCVIRIPLIFLVFAFEVIFVEGVGEICLRRVLPGALGWMKWVFFRAILLLCGIWYIEEQVDKTGDAARIHPRAGDLIACNHTSPLDLIYLAAKYDPVFVSCFVSTDKVQQTSFLTALWRSLHPPLLVPPPNSTLLTIQDLSKKLPHRIIVIFPETTPTNGRALLTFSPALPDHVSQSAFPLSIKYTPADITLPTPSPWKMLWRTTSFVKHSMRVRIPQRPVPRGTSFHDSMRRTGRMKSVGLSARDKIEFLDAWKRKKR